MKSAILLFMLFIAASARAEVVVVPGKISPALGAVPNDSLDSSSITKQGNVFNGVSQIVKTDGTGKLPAIDGSQLTNLPSGGSTASNSSGTYTPTLTPGNNVEFLTMTGPANWARADDIVTVWGILDLDTLVVAPGATAFNMSLPFASDIQAGRQLAGSAVNTISDSLFTFGDAAADEAVFYGEPVTAAPFTYSFTFIYTSIE